MWQATPARSWLHAISLFLLEKSQSVASMGQMLAVHKHAVVR